MEPDVRQIDRYLLYPPFAYGGMATIHLARQLGPGGIGRVVAIKRLQEAYARDAEFVKMFLDEARITTGIEHPNVIKTYDVLSMDGELMLVMELVRGDAFSRLLKESKKRGMPPPLPIVSAVVLGALEGLHAAHESVGPDGESLNIVHRDVSPHNVLVGTDGIPRIADFGIAKALGRSYATRSGEIKGKLAYMAPEQIRDDPVDRRADIWAVSVVLWEALAGKRLFEGQEAAVLFAVLENDVAPPSSHRADVPPALDAIVRRGLAKKPADRYPTALDMARELEAVVPPARPREIGAWVASLARVGLDKQAVLIQDMESDRRIRDQTLDSLRTRPEEPKTEPGTTAAVEPHARSATPLVLGLATFAAILCGMLVVVLLRGGGAPPREPAGTAVIAPTEPSAPETRAPEPPASAAAASAAVPAASTPAASSVASASATRSLSVPPTAPVRVPPTVAPPPKPPTTATYGYEF